MWGIEPVSELERLLMAYSVEKLEIAGAATFCRISRQSKIRPGFAHRPLRTSFIATSTLSSIPLA
jgi:hypothetical protein